MELLFKSFHRFFIKKEAAKKVGYYNVKYKYHSDYDYFYRMIVKEKLKGIATKKNELFGVLEEVVFLAVFLLENFCLRKLKLDMIIIKTYFIVVILFYKILKNFKKFVRNKN